MSKIICQNLVVANLRALFRERFFFCRARKIIYRFLLLCTFIFSALSPVSQALAQENYKAMRGEVFEVSNQKASILSPIDKVEVKPLSRDPEISQRLKEILEATKWFSNTRIHVQHGVVFLEGETNTEDFKQWAGNLARNTEDVTAVINKIEVLELGLWDFKPALSGIEALWRKTVRKIPLLISSVVILAITFLGARLTVFATRSYLKRRLPSELLRNIVAYSAALGVFLFGLHIVLGITGLTSIALTVVGGTGLLGIIFGFAFRDIAENFLASVFLSIQSPFDTGDLVEISGITGVVQSLTTRATVLMTLAGVRVQIPNSLVYKTSITNFTVNHNRREDFIIGIGYDDVIVHAQEIALKVLEGHPAVLNDPEPWVLVDSLGKSTVNLRVYFWVDGKAHSCLKVKSSIVRLIKRAFQNEGISMPDEAREIIFPRGVLVHLDRQKSDANKSVLIPEQVSEPSTISTPAEADLRSETKIIKKQESQIVPRGEAENLLQDRPEVL